MLFLREHRLDTRRADPDGVAHAAMDPIETGATVDPQAPAAVPASR